MPGPDRSATNQSSGLDGKMAAAAPSKAHFFCAQPTSEQKARITGMYSTPTVSTKMHQRAQEHSKRQQSAIRD